jgi:hypothetical protein
MIDEIRAAAITVWLEEKKSALIELAEAKSMIKMLAETVSMADRGLRQQQSAGIDEIMSNIRAISTALASIQHKLEEPLPA